jgi:PAS domain S-box-containing protein
MDLKLQIAAREQAETAVRALASGLEAKIRRLVNANIIGIFIWSFDGRIIDANDAFLRIVGYGRDDLVSGRLLWKELTPAEWHNADERRVRELETTGSAQPHEKEYFHKNGYRVPVLVGGATFEEKSDEGVAFVLDLTDRKRAEAAIRESEQRYSEVQNELAHANRVDLHSELRRSWPDLLWAGFSGPVPRAGDLVDKILRGTRPGDIPVEQADKFEPLITLSTPRAGVEDRRAVPDEVIE